MAGEVTLLGKAPARADFVRINHGQPSALALDEWLQRNLEELVLGGKREAPAARFLFCPGSGQSALMGLMAPSRDKAGRAFPVALFVQVPEALSTRRPWVLPLACASLLMEARALVDALGELDYESLKARVAAVEAPGPEAYERAAETAEKLFARTAPDVWLEHALQARDDAALAGALYAASDPAGERGARVPVLECAVHETVDALFWLALASRRAAGPVSFFWTEPAIEPASGGGAALDAAADGAPTRLLLCPSPPPAQTLLLLASPKAKPGLLWSLSDPTARVPVSDPAKARALLERLRAAENLAALLRG